MKALTNNSEPPSIQTVRTFRQGDAVRVKTADAGLPHGAVLPILGYSKTREGTNIIVAGTMPKTLREYCLQPERTREVFFIRLPRLIAEIPVCTAEEYLEFIPARQERAVIMMGRYERKEPLSQAA